MQKQEVRSRSGKHKHRCHSIKHNALCSLSEILSIENITAARIAEKTNAHTLKNKGLRERIKAFCDMDNAEYWENEFRIMASSEKYTPKPIRIHRIPKDNGKEREIYIRDNPMDRLVERAIYLQTAPVLEKTLSNAAYAYRPGVNMGQMIKEIQRYREEGFNSCIKADLSKFFNTIDQTILREELQKTLHPDPGATRLLNKFISSRYYDSRTGSVCTLDIGVAQGGTMAPLLANFYCNPLDKVIESVSGIKYFRYADDILIIGKDVQEVGKAYSILLEELEKRKLKINEEKLDRGTLTGMDILGIRFAENNSLAIPEGRLRKKIRLICYTEDSCERIRKWIGLIQHYRQIDISLLEETDIPVIVREECSKAEIAEELLDCLQRVKEHYTEQKWEEIEELYCAPVTYGTYVPIRNGSSGFAGGIHSSTAGKSNLRK